MSSDGFFSGILLGNAKNDTSFVSGVNLVTSDLFLEINPYEATIESLYTTIYGTCSASGTLTVNGLSDGIIREGENWNYYTRLAPYQNNIFTFVVEDSFGNTLTKTANIYCDFKCGFLLDVPPSKIVLNDLDTKYNVALLDNKIVYDSTVKPTLTPIVETGLGIKYGNYDNINLEPDLVAYGSQILKTFTILNETFTVVDVTNNYIYHVTYDVLVKTVEQEIEEAKVIITGPISWFYKERKNTCDKYVYYKEILDENKFIIKVK